MYSHFKFGRESKNPVRGLGPDGAVAGLHHLSKMALGGCCERRVELYAGFFLEQADSAETGRIR
jgi:hypothetical protein